MKYWTVDTREFFFWFSCAFFAGAGPNLAGDAGWVYLLALTFTTGLIALIIWKKTKRKEGIGVFVHFPDELDTEKGNESLRKYAANKMSRLHRDWFRSGPDQREKPADERVDWTIKTIEHRLIDAGFEIGQDPSLFLYLYSHHEEAFILGQRLSQAWRKAKGFLPPLDAEDYNRLVIDFRACVLSSYRGKDADYEIDLRKVLEQKSSTPETSPKSFKFARFSLSADFNTPPPDIQRLAVVIDAFNDGENSDAVWSSAREAAAGKKANGYLITPDDYCENALCFRISVNELIDEFAKKKAESTIGEIIRLVEEENGKLYGRKRAPVRLFIKAPAIIAFAAGAALPPGSRLVPFSATLAKAVYCENDEINHPNRHDLIAIVDGDDVGTQTERNLLSKKLTEAIKYSRQADESIKYLIEGISKVPGVRLLSTGGDSAIFGLRKNSTSAFEETLDKIRKRSNFRVSCGYGPDSRSALLALRMAKTSGKNKTIPYHED
ncbi:hypothetical protein [Saccharopolyspora shandongensis]|uniref:hypothetical protein n=1 Tax=Saccharopolyspora shandongensis TaxID=418495 RepID=UPI0033DFDCBA